MKMRKSNTLLAPVLLAFVLLTGGCAATAQSPAYGGLYTSTKGPVAATANASATQSPKVGRAEANSYLGLIAVGDASIQAAMEDGNITEVHHVDYETTSILGLFATYTVVVYGE